MTKKNGISLENLDSQAENAIAQGLEAQIDEVLDVTAKLKFFPRQREHRNELLKLLSRLKSASPPHNS